MSILLKLVWGWVLRHWMTLLVATFLSWVTIGVSYLTTRPTTTIQVGSGGRVINANSGYKPTFGCATGNQFFGWAHETIQRGGTNGKEKR